MHFLHISCIFVLVMRIHSSLPGCWLFLHHSSKPHNNRFVCALGSGPRYMIRVTLFCTMRESENVSRAILACPCVFSGHCLFRPTDPPPAPPRRSSNHLRLYLCQAASADAAGPPRLTPPQSGGPNRPRILDQARFLQPPRPKPQLPLQQPGSDQPTTFSIQQPAARVPLPPLCCDCCIPYFCPILLSHCRNSPLTYPATILAAGKRKVPKKVVQQAQKTVANQLDVLGSHLALRYSFGVSSRGSS